MATILGLETDGHAGEDLPPQRAQHQFRGDRHLGDCRSPSGRNASLTAFMMQAGAPAVPASPAPLAPSSELAVGVTTWPISMLGISPAMEANVEPNQASP